jgi:hypothetical protein
MVCFQKNNSPSRLHIECGRGVFDCEFDYELDPCVGNRRSVREAVAGDPGLNGGEECLKRSVRGHADG